MSNLSRGKFKKKATLTPLMPQFEASIFTPQNLLNPSTLYTPIPIRSNGALMKEQEISQPNGMNLKANLLLALLDVSSNENYLALNSLASILQNTKEPIPDENLNCLVENLLKNSKMLIQGGPKEMYRLLSPNSHYLRNSKFMKDFQCKKKSIRKQTSFAVTDVKSEPNSADERGPVYHAIKQTNQNFGVENSDDSEIPLSSSKNSGPLKNYDILPAEIKKKNSKVENTNSSGSLTTAKMVGPLTEKQRKVKVLRYLEK